MTYDYIIVGAGSSGATLAARLTEDASCRVLLLEAGPDYRSADAPPEMRSPNPGRMLTHPRFSWTQLMARRTEAQPQRLFWRGRGLGGSSAINGQIAIRPPLSDFGLWGVPSWSSADVLPLLLQAGGRSAVRRQAVPRPRRPDTDLSRAEGALGPGR